MASTPSWRIERIVYSSRSFESTIPQSVRPASSSILRAIFASHVRSPESIRMPDRRSPRAFISRPTVIAFLTPCSTSYVSTSNTQFFGNDSAYARNAVSSSGNDMTQECACVPETGMLNIRPARTFEVEAQPPTTAARLAQVPPAAPCARRKPNSATGAPADWQTRAALEAMSVSKLTQLSSGVSMSWHSKMGPITRTSGSFGNTIVPSVTASMSTESLKSER